MSNLLKIPPVTLHLSDKHFDYSKLIAGKVDLDGNALQVDDDGISFFHAELTTWRELRNFICQAIAPAAKDVGEGCKIMGKIESVREESDDFKKPFTLFLCFSLLPENAWRDYAS
jgi:hypothetical protein